MMRRYAKEKLLPNRAEEAAKTELEHRVKLYQFYFDTYTKGITLYLGITGLLLKFAIESEDYRGIFGVAGFFCAMAILIPLFFAFRHEIVLREDFDRLAATTKTNPISSSPLRMLSYCVAAFWVIIFAGWVYVLFYLTPN